MDLFPISSLDFNVPSRLSFDFINVSLFIIRLRRKLLMICFSACLFLIVHTKLCTIFLFNYMIYIDFFLKKKRPQVLMCNHINSNSKDDNNNNNDNNRLITKTAMIA